MIVVALEAANYAFSAQNVAFQLSQVRIVAFNAVGDTVAIGRQLESRIARQTARRIARCAAGCTVLMTPAAEA